ncbi:MAG: T9SS type A sorting domain-containing protein [Ilyomonas sp.]
MKKHITKLCLFIIIIFSAEKILSQKLSAQKDSLLSWQTKRDNKTRMNVQNLTLKLNPTITTQANVSTSSITDSRDVRVFPSPNIQSEVHISINKTNPNNLVASANTLLGATGGDILYNQGYYFSLNGGKSWSGADFLQNAGESEILGDPATAFAADGNAMLTTINFDDVYFTYGYLFQLSRNGGNTWTFGAQANGAEYFTFGFDKLMTAADDSKTSPYANNFYAAWTDFSVGNGEILFNRSTNEGITFSSPLILRTSIAGFGQGTNVQTGPDGQVYVCWADHAFTQYPYQADGLGFTSSNNGGISFKPYKVVFKYDGIRTFADVGTFNHTRVADFPAMAVDKSNGEHRGRIYVTYPTKQNHVGKAIIQVRYSDDEGKSWSDPKTVSIQKGKQNFFPWIAVDDVTGEVWVVYDSFDEIKKYATNVYVAHSSNGGSTWENQKVSDVSHITKPIDDNLFATGYAGDYIGITAYGGKAYPIWHDERNGTWQLYCSPVTSNAAQKTSEAPLISQAITKDKSVVVSPNPVNDLLHLQVLNEQIKAIQLVNESGTIVKKWNDITADVLNIADVPTGAYILKIIGKENRVYTQKIIKN